jgi:GT2 family glycosyltransferase
MTIAILMTCFNRVETTLCCLKHLFACEKPEGVVFDVYLVDDASPDRTGYIVKKRYLQISVIEGTGDLFWCGGMRLAWESAVKVKKYDGFLWLNDDTILYRNALSVLAQEARSVNYGIIVGAVCDPETGQTTYGFTGNPPREPDGTLSPIRNETMNGNVVWVPEIVWQRLGGLRSYFTHSMGDTEYGLRAQKNGVPIWLTPQHVGTCRTNTGMQWNDSSLSFKLRWKIFHSPKGCPPCEFKHIVQLLYPITWPLYMVKTYLTVFFPKIKRNTMVASNGYK